MFTLLIAVKVSRCGGWSNSWYIKKTSVQNPFFLKNWNIIIEMWLSFWSFKCLFSFYVYIMSASWILASLNQNNASFTEFHKAGMHIKLILVLIQECSLLRIKAILSGQYLSDILIYCEEPEHVLLI